MKNIIVTAASGQLGSEFKKKYQGHANIHCLSKSELDISDKNKLSRIFSQLKPDVILNTAAYTNVQEAESNEELAYSINVDAVNLLAHECLKTNTILIHFSTDFVFSGTSKTPYTEDDVPNPINVYGKSKLKGESKIIESKCRYIIFRTSWLYGIFGDNFVTKIIKLSQMHDNLEIISSEIGTPTNTEFVVDICNKFILNNLNNQTINQIYNLCPTGYVSRYLFAKKILEIFNPSLKNKCAIMPIESNINTLSRPKFSSLSNKKLSQTLGIDFKNWEIHLKKFLVRNNKQIQKDIYGL